MTLQERRKAAGLSQSQLAAASGLPVGAIQQYERGYRDVGGMGIRRAKALADALGCRIEDLIDMNCLTTKK
jgi:transcriptional regulator with XRE-family HTH domain